MIANHPDLLFAIIRNTIPNLALGRTGPVFVTRFPDVQEALSRPDVFNVTYAPMIDPSLGPFMMGRDCTEINQRDKGIMRAFMRMEDLPSVRQKVCQLANDAAAAAARAVAEGRAARRYLQPPAQERICLPNRVR
jgi:cytochrome P450